MEDCERRKAIELLKEMRSENKAEDEKSSKEIRLNWMYKSPGDLVDKEEYLLGKAIDKTFEVLNSAGNSNVVGRAGEPSNVPKRLLEKTDSIEQVDIAKKILEDPLYAIKQKEMEARKKLLNNPVKLKQIKQMLLERNKQYNLHKTKKRKSKNKTEQDLNLLILKKLKMFSDKEKKKALDKIVKSDCDSDSNSFESSSSDKKYATKRKRHHSSSDESDSKSESTSESEKSVQVKKLKNKKGKCEITDKKLSKRSEESRSNPSGSGYERNKESSSKTFSKRKHTEPSCDSDTDSSTSITIKKSQDKSKTNLTNSKTKHDKKNFKEKSSQRQDLDRDKKNTERNHRRKGFLIKESTFDKKYESMMPDSSRPEKRRKASPEQKKKVEANSRSLSHKEREEKLKEMIENAKIRKEDREKNLANHRKKLALEEESKTYDDDFMRRQMLHLTSQGTMADRIKSNINNIQRSKSSMNSNFLRK